jgi:putative ABC transport system substrate-binding protein
VKRREFITLLGSAAATWPLAARAQQSEPMRRIGVLMNAAADDPEYQARLADDPEYQARLAAFLHALQQLGWSDGHNVRIDIRWSAGNPDTMRKYAAELVALAPEVILATTSAATTALQQATRTVPIVFSMVLDPVGGGIVESLARPGGNTTGFLPGQFRQAASHPQGRESG